MKEQRPNRLTRREFLEAFFSIPALAFLTAIFPKEAPAKLDCLEPTPAIPDDEEDPTPSTIAGPFYKLRSPQRRSLLEPDIEGIRITLTGQVLSTKGEPIPNALVDFWHADNDGEYDNAGFRLRGHQFTMADGRYSLETIVPGLYGGRTRHFHVRVQPAKSRILTTQLFFPGERRNARDYLFRPELLMSVEQIGEGRKAGFNFVIKMD